MVNSFMKDRLVVGYSLENPFEMADYFKDADIVLVGSKAFKTISFKREIEGKDTLLLDIGKFSKAVKAPVFAAFKTDNYGLLRRSVGAYENGRLLSISDATRTFESCEAPSFGYKVLKTSAGKIGVAVSKDVGDLDCLKALVLCESELIINLYADFYDFSLEKLTPTIGYLTGVPVLSLSQSSCVAATGTGNVVCNSSEAFYKFVLPTKRRIFTVTKKTFGNI